MPEPRESDPQDAATPGSELTRRHWLRRAIFTTEHRAIGMQYLALALIAVAIGTALSLLMRIHLVWPDLRLPFFGVVPPEGYLALVTIHGTIMVFFVLTTAPQSGFANLVLPEQIGARGMAFPRLNALSFWLTALALCVLLAAFFVPGGAPISGWTSYPPLSAVPAAGPGQGTGMDLWIASIGLFCIASSIGAVNLLTTIVGGRCRGMTLMRMPLTVWSWFVTAILMLLSFSVLFAAILLLWCDRHYGTSFFVPMGDLVNGTIVGKGDGSPLLWLHLFWFFGHPEVYIAVLPGMGIVSSLIANFTRRPILGYRMMVWTTVLIGLLGLLVWGHHMFVSGMNPYAGTAFAVTTMAIAVPSTAKVLSWLGTLWGGGIERTTPMLYVLGFLSFFITGGLTGPILAQPALDTYLHNTYFVVAHFHLIMGMAAVFSIFAGVCYWFPLMTGRMMSERLGRWHFWLTFVGAYLVFFPMHFAGLAGEPRHYAQLTGATSSLASLVPLQTGITHSAFLLAAAQFLFLWNVLRSARRGTPAEGNPWRATTLEWAAGLDAPAVHRGPYEYDPQAFPSGFKMQWEADAEQE
ncbi:MAG: cytochrome c oxidase subunit I [Acidobacteria bacterium]|nr:cytochrome c oxidase subunit I [Acidobacteriota bacterium]MBW4044310.1 cytochrome c oxidase subunit I [Acidobacteriota bacterium]